MVDMIESRPVLPSPGRSSARQAAADYGIDLSITDYLFTLTPEQRLERHDQHLELVQALRQAGIDYYGFDPRNPPQARRERS
jgi:hypothetical protein